MATKRRFDFSDVHLYCVTTQEASPADYVKKVKQALAGGADAIQLRDKAMDAKNLAALCRDLQSLCDETGAFFILNDRVDVAYAANVDGVHLGQEDVPVRIAREILGHKKIIGASAHSVAQALVAQGEGADYVSCGPLFETPTKPDYKPVGLELIKQYKTIVKIPFVAIGGVDATNIADVITRGADRAAVVRAAFGAEDVEVSVKRLREKVLAAKKLRSQQFAGASRN